MGHAIRFTTCANDKIKAALKRIEKTAFDPEESCGYHGNMTVHKDVICKNREEAEKFIEKHDTGWYSDHAVRYKDGRKLTWLIKYEWHC